MKSLTILHKGVYNQLYEFSEGDNFIYEFSWEMSLKTLKDMGIKCQRIGNLEFKNLSANVMVDGYITIMDFFDLVKNNQINDLFITHKSIKYLIEYDDDEVYLYIKENYPENLIWKIFIVTSAQEAQVRHLV